MSSVRLSYSRRRDGSCRRVLAVGGVGGHETAWRIADLEGSVSHAREHKQKTQRTESTDHDTHSAELRTVADESRSHLNVRRAELEIHR
jgi:hypothetical protein